MTESDNNGNLGVGDPAPDFTLLTHSDGELNLAWYQGRKYVVLAFYPGDWTPVCSAQIQGYNEMFEFFEENDCQVLGISVDSVYCHTAWAKSMGGLAFPLMSDYWPHGKVCAEYDVLAPQGYADRSVFLIDKSGVIRFVQKVHPAEMPDNEELKEAIRELNVKA